MFERRLRLFLIFIFLGAFLLAARAAQVQVVQRNQWLDKAVGEAERPTYIPARRGDLLDYKGKVIATDVPAFEASVNYRVIGKEPDAKWLKDEATRRARSLPGWTKSDADGRLLLVSQEEQGVRNDLAEMWSLLARIGHMSPIELDAERDDIVADVKGKHDSYVQRQYGAATRAFEQAPTAPWYQRLIAGAPKSPDFDTYDKKQIGDELGFHVIVPDLTQQDYNELSLAQDRLPQFKPEGESWTSVLRLGPAQTRRYPYNEVACHVIGHVVNVSAKDRENDPNKDDELRRYSLNDRVGRGGVEQLAEQALRGSRGTKFSDRRGTELRADEADDGQNVTCSIDIELQAEIEQAFKTVEFVGADNPKSVKFPHGQPDVGPMNGAAVVIDVKTGQVRALVSVPTFDLNRFDEDYAKLVDDDLNRPMVNRALQDAIEPGSTVKPIVGLGVVTQGLARPEDTIECTGYPIIDGKRISKPRCWTMSMFKIAHHQVPASDPHPTGFLNLTDAIERSCNVYFETQGYKLKIQGLSYWMRQFGYDRRTGIGLAEARGLVPDRASIPPEEHGGAPLYSAIGQSWVLATPIQVCNEMATIARDGIWMRPTLLTDTSIVRPTTQPSDDAVPDRYDLHLDPAALAAVHEGMKRVVGMDGGTATAIRRKDIDLAAKSGSATASQLARFFRNPDGSLMKDEKGHPRFELVPYGTHDHPNPELPWYRETGVDEEGKPKGTHSWVAGYAPADHPQIAFAVYVEYGGSGGTGAASVVNKLIESCIQHHYLPTKPVAPAEANPSVQ